MKKLLALLIIGLFAFGAFAGCVGGNEEEVEGEVGDVTEEEVTVVPHTETFTFDGTVTGVWAAEYVGDPSPHEFPVGVGARSVHIVLEFTEGDCDFKAYNARGQEVAWADTIGPAETEDKTVDDSAAFKKTGNWRVDVIGAAAAETAYTLTIEVEYA